MINCNKDCVGCSILNKPKSVHSYTDYTNLEESDVLFLSDSFKNDWGGLVPFSDKELKLFRELIPKGSYSVAYSSAVKCPGVIEADMKADDRAICRTHLGRTVDTVKPKLIFACGNLAMKMLIPKASGINKKRGLPLPYESPNGHSCVVIPIFHPFSVIKEPKNMILFAQDISNSIKKYIQGKFQNKSLEYKMITEVSQLRDYEHLFTTDSNISFDLETTGLNFLTDKIQTCSISYRDKEGVMYTVVIPIHHKDSPILIEDRAIILDFLTKVLSNPNNNKFGANVKFDLKFLMREGIMNFKRIFDVALMHQSINENLPNNLKAMTAMYLPELSC